MLFIKTENYRLFVFNTFVPQLNNSPMVPVGARLNEWCHLSPPGVPLPTTRSSSVYLQKASHRKSSLPDCISIYFGVSETWPRDLESVRMCHMKFGWQIIWSFAQYHPVTIRSCPYQRCYNKTHHWLYRLSLQQCHYSTPCSTMH